MLEPRLYLCATPIGNLEDITLRVVRVLGEADCVYAEDTRHSGALLKHLGIRKPLTSCHAHNEAQKAEEIVQKVKDGLSVAYVSDAGLPGISDPGERLVAACIRENVKFEVLPGASALLLALVMSGLPIQNACFAGFLPRETKERRLRLASLVRHAGTLLFYESPLRVKATLDELLLTYGDRPAALLRELTKLHEEAVRGTLSSLAARYADEPPKGECVLAVGGAAEANAEQPPGRLEEFLARLLKQGVSAKDAAKQASAVLDVPRNEAYALALEWKEGMSSQK
ncbi:MAG TPA: 16S rRNA (cytidine(1402)-2'-O)-methyltransferase [Clostridia bacterium]|nr:16S rRNA (cytidine(1402)-2'-O)-methyltransferase [Clostridia bacterium]